MGESRPKRTVVGSNPAVDKFFSAIFSHFLFSVKKSNWFMVFMHLDLHFAAFAPYSVKDIVLLNKCVGAIVFTRYRVCICFSLVIIAHFWI